MIVKELIEKLQSLDPTIEVLARPNGYDQYRMACGVRQFRATQVCDDNHPAPFAE